MKIINVSTSLDVTNLTHLEAFTAFMHALGGHPIEVTSNGGQVPKIEVANIPGSKPDLVSAKPAKATKKPEAQEEPIETGVQAPATEENDAAQEITLESLRAEVATLAKKGPEMRDTLKAKLAELGATGVSNLDEANYSEFLNFLKTLA